MMTLLKLQ